MKPFFMYHGDDSCHAFHLLLLTNYALHFSNVELAVGQFGSLKRSDFQNRVQY